MADSVEDLVRDAMNEDWKDHHITNWLKSRGYPVTRHQVRKIMKRVEVGSAEPGTHVTGTKCDGNEMEVTVNTDEQVKTLDDLCRVAEIDLEIWNVTKWVANTWAGKWQTKAWLARKTHEQSNIEALLDDLRANSPVVPHRWPGYRQTTSGRVRALEIAIMDPHFGLRAFKGASGDDYDFDSAERIWWSSIEKLLMRARYFGPFDKICFVAGNDFLHADNVFHTTTQGTGQPEMDAWHHTFERGEELLIKTILTLSKEARVDVIMVPGNHARQSEYALGRVLNAYFRNDENVMVDCSASPYKFWRFGVNLVGFEHGHSIKAPRLGSLMANECKDDWAQTWQREWHCGDQHRESAVFSDFGVNTKYLPSMVTWNEWHKIKSFSWAHRASLGFVYDEYDGLISTPQVNARELYHG